MKTQLHRSTFAACTALALALTLVFGSSIALAGKKPGGGGGGSGGTGGTTTKPPTPTNFRVTAITAYTISVAWDPAPATSGDFSYHLSGTRITAAILPKTATSHTFTALAPGNDYWLGMYAKDAAGNAGGQANLGPVVLPLDITPPWTAPVVSVGEVGANYAHLSWTRAEDDDAFRKLAEARALLVRPEAGIGKTFDTLYILASPGEPFFAADPSLR